MISEIDGVDSFLVRLFGRPLLAYGLDLFEFLTFFHIDYNYTALSEIYPIYIRYIVGCLLDRQHVDVTCTTQLYNIMKHLE